MGRERLPPPRSRPHGPGPLPDARPHLGRRVERHQRPVVAADDRGFGPPRHPAGPNRSPERRNRLWPTRALRPRPPDPLRGHGAHGWRGPHLPPRHPLDQCVRPDAEPGRPTPGTGGPTASQPSPPIPDRLGLLSASPPSLSFFCRRGRISCGPPSLIRDPRPLPLVVVPAPSHGAIF